jgi:hemoglobin/transferrin/lactoferrin receptor protein
MKQIYLLIFLIAFLSVESWAQVDSTGVDSAKSKSLREVIIKGTPRKREVGMVKLEQKQLAAEMTSDIRDMVRYIPGVGISYSGTRGSNRGFAIRGVEANRVAITVDGILQPEVHENMVFSAYGLSNASRIEFDPYFVSAIDIQKGAASFSVGSGALGGAVNYATKTADDLVEKDKSYGAIAQVAYNSKDNMRMLLGGAAIKKGKFEGILMFARREGNELRNFQHGKLNRNVTSTAIDPMDYTQHTLLGKISYKPAQHHRIDVSYYMLDKKVNAEIWSQEPLDIFTSADNPYYYSHDQTLSKSYTIGYAYTPENGIFKKIGVSGNLQNSWLDARTWSEYYRPNFYGNGNYSLIYEGRRDKYRGQEIKDRMAKLHIDVKEWNTIYLGKHEFTFTGAVTYKYNDNRNVDVEEPRASNEIDGYTVRMGQRYEFGESMGRFINSYSFQRPINRAGYQLSLMDKVQVLPRLSMILGGRYDHFNTRDKDWDYNNDQYYIDYLLRNLGDVKMNQSAISDSDKGLSFLATANYRFYEYLQLAYKFSTGFRVPTPEEKYFQYFSSWPSFLILSNRELKPETSKNHEIELAGSGALGTYTLNVYTSNYDDFIDVEQGTIEVTNQLDNSKKNISYARNINRRSASLKGFDAKVFIVLKEIWAPLKGFSLTSAASYAKGTTSYGTSMLGVQPLTGFAGLDYLSKNEKWNASFKANMFNAKKRAETRFIEKTPTREVQRSFPSLFLQDATTFDLLGYYNITRKITVRAGVYNITNQKYWRWDDLRQLTNPALLPHIENFFREGSKTISRFSQPKRYFSLALEVRM